MLGETLGFSLNYLWGLRVYRKMASFTNSLKRGNEMLISAALANRKSKTIRFEDDEGDAGVFGLTSLSRFVIQYKIVEPALPKVKIVFVET